MRAVLVLLGILSLAACHAQPPGTPDETYRAFVHAAADAHQGKEVKLLEYFDAPTRAALASSAKAAAQATGKNMPDDPDYQLLLGRSNVPALAEVRVVDESADAATLEVVTDGGGRAQVKMVREGGRWRIHLDGLPTGSP